MFIKLTLLLFLTATSHSVQPPPQQGLPKVEDVRYISMTYTKNAGGGKISAADERGKVQQWLEVWENESKSPTVVTYVLVGDGVSYSATWGRGPVSTRAFSCKSTGIPDFGEKTIWAATVTGSEVTFVEIKDDDIAGMFENLVSARANYGKPQGSAMIRGKYADIVKTNIVNLMKEKNRNKWLEKGWLQAASTCVQHF